MEKTSLESKKVLLAGWGCENPQDTYMYQIYYLILKKFFPNLETFDTKKNYFQFGKDKMNNNLLEFIRDKDYDLILFAFEYDEFYPETLEKIRDLYPRTKSVVIICDDDARFDSWSRYIALFFDYVITSQDYLNEYKKDGIKTFFHLDYNTVKLEPMNIEKIYDVTFIGRPKADRNEVIKYLLDNGIKITLFGWDWYKYPEFAGVYGGPLSQEDYAKVINQSKINLSPAKAGYVEQRTQYNMKGRYFEVALCKSFQLIERFPTLLKFFNEKEIGMYVSQEDMLSKIRYYLKNEKEREKIAERAYNKTIKSYNREKQLIKILTEIFNHKEKKNLFEINKKIITLKKKDLFSDLSEKLEGIDYVSFKNENLRYSSKFKDLFLTKALNMTDKNIACCDYYVSPKGLKDYMIFLSKFSFKRIGNESNRLIDLNQLMVRKEFFLNNVPLFIDFFDGKEINLINEENTAFVSLPLVSIKKFRKIEYGKMKKAFEFRFQNELFSLIYQKKILLNKYPYLLAIKSLIGNPFIFKYLLEILKDKSNKDKLSVNKVYIENSSLERFNEKN
jgi:spore maturation protein CgeB